MLLVPIKIVKGKNKPKPRSGPITISLEPKRNYATHDFGTNLEAEATAFSWTMCLDNLGFDNVFFKVTQVF